MSEALVLIDRLCHERPRALELAEVVSLAAIVDRPLLRVARLELVQGGDAGTEADLWTSALIKTRSPEGLTFLPDIAIELRRRLARDRARLDDAWRVTRRMHAHFPPTLELEEELARLSAIDDDESRHEIARQLRRVVAALGSGERDGLATWTARVLAGLPDHVRELPESIMLDTGARLRLGRALPPQLQALPSWLPWIAPLESDRVPVGIEMFPDHLMIHATPKPPGQIVHVPDTGALLLEVSWREGRKTEVRRVTFRRDETTSTPIGGSEIAIKTVAGEVYMLRRRGSEPRESAGAFRDLNDEKARHRPFFGRTRLLGDLASWAAFDPASRFDSRWSLGILARPGGGKSALITAVGDRIPKDVICATHYFRMDIPHLASARVAERSILAQLEAQRPLSRRMPRLEDALRAYMAMQQKVVLLLDSTDVADGSPAQWFQWVRTPNRTLRVLTTVTAAPRGDPSSDRPTGVVIDYFRSNTSETVDIRNEPGSITLAPDVAALEEIALHSEASTLAYGQRWFVPPIVSSAENFSALALLLRFYRTRSPRAFPPVGGAADVVWETESEHHADYTAWMSIFAVAREAFSRADIESIRSSPRAPDSVFLQTREDGLVTFYDDYCRDYVQRLLTPKTRRAAHQLLADAMMSVEVANPSVARYALLHTDAHRAAAGTLTADSAVSFWPERVSALITLAGVRRAAEVMEETALSLPPGAEMRAGLLLTSAIRGRAATIMRELHDIVSVLYAGTDAAPDDVRRAAERLVGAPRRIVVLERSEATARRRPLLQRLLGPRGSKSLATFSDDGSIELWDVTRGRLEQTLHNASPVTALALFDRNRRLVCGSRDGVLTIWQFSGRASSEGRVAVRRAGIHESAVAGLAVMDNETKICSWCADGTITVTDTDLNVLSTGEVEGGITAARMISDATIAIGTARGAVELWRLPQVDHSSTIANLDSPVTAIAYNLRSDVLLATSARKFSAGTTAWGWHGQPATVTAAVGHRQPIAGIGLLGGDRTITWSEDGTIQRWERDAAGAWSTSSPNTIREPGGITACAVAGVPPRIVTGTPSGEIHIHGDGSVASFHAHELAVRHIKVLDDRNTFLTISDDGSICAWNAVRGEMKFEFGRDRRGVQICRTWGRDQTLVVRDGGGIELHRRTSVAVLQQKTPAGIALSPDGFRLLSWLSRPGGSSTITEGRLPWSRRRTFGAEGERVTAGAVNDDGTLIACGCESGRVYIRQSERGTLLDVGHKGRVTAIFIREDDDSIVSACTGGVVIRTPTRTRGRPRSVDVGSAVTSMRISSRGIAMAGTADGTIVDVDLNRGTILARRSGHRAAVKGLEFVRFDERNVLVSRSDDSTLRFWDLRDNRPLGEASGHRNRITDVAVDGRTGIAYSCALDGTIRAWTLEGERVGTVFGESPFRSITIARQGVLAGDDDGRLWNVAATRVPLSSPEIPRRRRSDRD